MNQPDWIEKPLVLAMHESALSRHGGSTGTRDEGLLDSALARPEQLFHYERADIFHLAATYAHGIVKNHPFIDGNKRTGFLAAALFLETNGWKLIAPEVEAVTQTLGLAAGMIEAGEYAAWLQRSCEEKA